MASVLAACDAAAMIVTAPHRTRAIRFLGLHQLGAWRVKLYGIAAEGERPRQGLVEATTAALPASLPDGGGIGFAIAHDGRDGCYALIHWWANENEVHQRLLSAPVDDPAALRPHPPPAIGCVWELAVTDFERRAWLDHVLAREGGPDVDGYLAARFEGEV
jgi:hypothetical protein